MTRRLLLLTALFFATVSTALFGLEITNGKLRLVLTEDTNRFSIYYNTSGSNWTPLFYAQDPRTTILGVLAGNDFYRMGDSSRFKASVTKTSNGGEISWTSQTLTVSQDFAFKTSIGASGADGLLVTVRVTNNTAGPMSVGVRYLIDTYLGEENRIEFMTPGEASMSNETEFSGQQVPAYWISPGDRKLSVALEEVMRGSGVTTPDRVVFANWKRLNDAGWDFTSDPNRNFNLLPYSINDSAVAVYYDAKSVAAGASRTITLLLGQYSAAGWGSVVPVSSTASASANTTTQPNAAVTQLLNQANAAAAPPASSTSQGPSANSPQSDARTAVQTDLSTVNGVLDQIQKMLASPQGVTQSDIDGLRQVLDTLNAKKTQAGLQ
ncbi:MAG TPA: hypothetical protein VMW69_13525 [Spirochaetia bacterium]|nr:hypothetical protein [Spirochaetia bacterium]